MISRTRERTDHSRRMIQMPSIEQSQRDPLRRTGHVVNRHAGKLVLFGIAGVAWRNWWLWRHERALLTRKTTVAPPPSFETWATRPRVSVLVAAWNEADQIECHIRSFLELRYPNKELILCAGGDDGTYDLARRTASSGVIVLEQRPGEGKQRALQQCLARSDGDIIVLTDADCLFSDDAFLRLIEPIVLGEAQVVTGVSEPKKHQLSNSLVQYQWFRDRVWSFTLPRSVDGVLGRNCALVRGVVEKIGAFEQPVRTGTDYFLSRLLVRAGYAIRAVPESRIATDYPETPRTYLQMWRRWNKNLLIHGLRFRAWNDVRGILTASVLSIVILLTPFSTPILGRVAWLVSLLLFSTATTNRLRRHLLGAQLTGEKPSWRVLLQLSFYTCLDMVAALLALRDSLDPKLRTRW